MKRRGVLALVNPILPLGLEQFSLHNLAFHGNLLIILF